MIPSFNTLFAKVHTQGDSTANNLSIVVQKGNYSGAIVRGTIVLWGISWEAIIRGVVVQGLVILEGGQKPGGYCPGRILWGEAFVQGVVVQGGVFEGKRAGLRVRR